MGDLGSINVATNGEYVPLDEVSTEPYSTTCDWGDCEEEITGWRLDAEGHGWLVVCAGHCGRIRELGKYRS